MRIYASRWFQRFARREGISDSALLDAVARAERGQIDADEERQFKEAAKHVLALKENQLAELLKRGYFVEVRADGQKVS